VWDEGISLDHSVRKPSEALDMASEDLPRRPRLLDGRVICGEDKVAEPVIEGARERWARQKPPWLGVLAEGSPNAMPRTATSASCSNPT